MTTIIKGLELSVIGEIDDILSPLWREGELESYDNGGYIVTLNESWLNMEDGVITLTNGENFVVLFTTLFVEIIIT